MSNDPEHSNVFFFSPGAEGPTEDERVTDLTLTMDVPEALRFLQKLFEEIQAAVAVDDLVQVSFGLGRGEWSEKVGEDERTILPAKADEAEAARRNERAACRKLALALASAVGWPDVVRFAAKTIAAQIGARSKRPAGDESPPQDPSAHLGTALQAAGVHPGAPPSPNTRVVRAPGTSAEIRGTVLASVPSERHGFSVMIEWDEGSGRQSPEAETWAAFHVGLVRVDGAPW